MLMTKAIDDTYDGLNEIEGVLKKKNKKRKQDRTNSQ